MRAWGAAMDTPPANEAADRINILLNRGRDRFMIDPRTNAFIPYWDVVMVVLVAFTATVTPYETAFVEEPNITRDGVSAMWILNRIVDTAFMVDIVLTCNTMYELEGLQHGSWIGRRSQVISRYMRSPWFLVDVVSVFPWWVFSLLGPSGGGASATSTDFSAAALDASADGGTSETLDSLRLVKLLRMLKLARMFKAAQVFAPVVKDWLMVRLEFTFAALKVLELFMWLFLFTHLQACFWGLLSGLSDNGSRPTWIRAYESGHKDAWGEPPQPWEVYVSAVYWSAMTVTSIGYGEMLPENSAERIVCTFFMLISGMVWTYVLSTAAGIAATLNPNTVLYHTTMDQLNVFMRERKLPKKLRHELRKYFETARYVREINDDANLFENMSPLLQGRVAFEANREWLTRVWYLAKLPETRETTDFIAVVAKGLTVRAYVAEERAPIGQLYVVRRGMCVKNWNFLRSGMVWGDDIIIDALHLMDHSQAVALTYMEVFVLTREALDGAVDSFVEAQAAIEHAARRIRLQRELLIYFCERMGSKPRSFIRARDATGYIFVTNQMSIDQKIDALHNAFVDDGELRLSRSRPTSGDEPKALSSVLRIPVRSATFKTASSTHTSQETDASAAHHKSTSASGSWWGGMISAGENGSASRQANEASELAALRGEVRHLGATVERLAAHAEKQTAMMARLDRFLSQQGPGTPAAAVPSRGATPGIGASTEPLVA